MENTNCLIFRSCPSITIAMRVSNPEYVGSSQHPRLPPTVYRWNRGIGLEANFAPQYLVEPHAFRPRGAHAPKIWSAVALDPISNAHLSKITLLEEVDRGLGGASEILSLFMKTYASQGFFVMERM